MNCPLCGEPTHRPSWLGSTFFLEQEFTYIECCGCGSLYCEPMPGKAMLALMYGRGYATNFQSEIAIPDPKEPGRTLEWLQRMETGVFVDYGCGQGALLVDAAKLNWEPIGVELDAEVATQVTNQTGFRVVNDVDELINTCSASADAVHLGDVIEHLTLPDQQMPAILRLLKPGGVLIAQGPLEANANLFTFCLSLVRRLRPWHRTEMATYHVLLATAPGQRKFFRRFGLNEIEYSVHEVAWPAPDHLTWSDLKNPRATGLFLLRRLSRQVSRWFPGKWGNRYFYVGQWGG